MPQASTAPSAPAGTFQDGLGKRHQLVDPLTHDPLEVLCLRSALTAVPSFEFAVRERVAERRALADARFARVRDVSRLNTSGAPLMVVSEFVPGVRLSDTLAQCERRELTIDVGGACRIIRQLAGALATLEEHAPGATHGAIAPERLVLTPDGRVVLVEHILGSALSQLQYPAARYWNELRVFVPPSADPVRLDARTDVAQLGGVALALFMGRRLNDEDPSALGDTVDRVWTTTADGGSAPLPQPLRWWLRRALQLDAQNAFSSAIEAWSELEAAIGNGRFAAPADVESSPASSPSPRNDPRTVEHERASADRPYAVRAPVDQSIWWPTEVLDAPALPSIASSIRPATRGSATVTPYFEMAVTPRSRRMKQTAALTLAAVVCGGILVTNRYVRRGAAAATATPPVTPPAMSTRGQLEVRTDPPAATITIDGLALGKTPIRLDLPAGDHSVDLTNDFGTVSQNVTIKGGALAALTVPLASAPPPPSAGWIVVTAPAEVEVYEGGQLVGSSTGRVALPAGRHRLEVVNGPLGFRTTRDVMVQAGQLATLAIQFPTVSTK